MIMYYPTLDEIKQLRHFDLAADAAGAKNPQVCARSLLVPLCCDVRADMETPVSVYCKTAQGPFSFLLESVANGERIARYSFIGIDPYMVMTQHGETAKLYKSSCERKSTDTRSSLGHPCSTPYTEEGSFIIEEVSCHDPLELAEAEMSQDRLVKPAGIIDELPHFHGGAVGYLAYESVARFEHLPIPSNDELRLPQAIFCFTETVLVFDHLKHRVRIVTHLHLDAPDLDAEYKHVLAIIEDVQQRLRQSPQLPEEPEPEDDAAPSQIISNRSPGEFEAMVCQAKEYIRAGDIFQVVLSQRLSRHVDAAPFTVYRALRAINPSPYMFFLDLQDFHIIGASPELLVRVEDREVTIHPIAGTRRRGDDPQSDQQLADELKNDPKERAEHVMLVDLGRNDVGRVSIPGSVQVSQFMEIERYSHVMHLVSNVTGQLRPAVSPYDALRAGFPAGTVSGAPKIRAMEIISELEEEQRGVYAGAVGYFSHSGNLDTAIALRTMVMQKGRAYIQAGGGIVADSDPGEEYQESMNKARALLRALDEAEVIAQERREGIYAFTHR